MPIYIAVMLILGENVESLLFWLAFLIKEPSTFTSLSKYLAVKVQAKIDKLGGLLIEGQKPL
jgi:hypothetical protein